MELLTLKEIKRPALNIMALLWQCWELNLVVWPDVSYKNTDASCREHNYIKKLFFYMKFKFPEILCFIWQPSTQVYWTRAHTLALLPGSQSVVPGQTSSASHGKWLEMQVLGLHTHLLCQQLWVGPTNLGFNKLSSSSNGHSILSTTVEGCTTHHNSLRQVETSQAFKISPPNLNLKAFPWLHISFFFFLHYLVKFYIHQPSIFSANLNNILPESHTRVCLVLPHRTLINSGRQALSHSTKY